MIGGRIIENAPSEHGRRIWCVDRNGDECAVFAEPAAEALAVGENIWWQSGKIMARGDTVTFRKVGFSFNPQHEDARNER